jgi:hypothetical protein
VSDPLNSKKLVHTKQGRGWLEQFDLRDQNMAIAIANNLVLISHIEFERNLLQTLEEVASGVEGCIGFFAIRELKKEESTAGKFGSALPFYSQVASQDGKSVNPLSSSSDQGSEARVAHVIRQFCKSNPGRYFNHPTLNILRSKKCDAIVFVDDFIGSGRRVRDFLDSFWPEPSVVSWLSGKQIYFQVVAYSGIDTGIELVRRHLSKPRVKIHRDAPTFNNIFWSKTKKQSAEALFTKYGRIANEKRGKMWWGYEEGKAAIIFEHGCPNNTPAILWEPGFKGNSWRGLFPNRTISSQVASVFPPEIVSGDPIQILVSVGQTKLAKSGALLRRGSAGKTVLVILGLIAKGQRKRSTISFATGLNVEDCERFLESCIKWSFITVQRRITAKGLAELHAARKQKIAQLTPLDIGDSYYYPIQLREAARD